MTPVTVFVAIMQPDGDWDHFADLLGVYATRDEAEKWLPRAGHGYTVQVVECEVGRDRRPA